MNPYDIEPGCIFLGTGGPTREVVTIDRRNHLLTYRKSGSLEIHELGIPKFIEWALTDVTEMMGKEGLLPGHSKVQGTRKGVIR